MLYWLKNRHQTNTAVLNEDITTPVEFFQWVLHNRVKILQLTKPGNVSAVIVSNVDILQQPHNPLQTIVVCIILDKYLMFSGHSEKEAS
jgi:hypothetical protein